MVDSMNIPAPAQWFQFHFVFVIHRLTVDAVFSEKCHKPFYILIKFYLSKLVYPDNLRRNKPLPYRIPSP